MYILIPPNIETGRTELKTISDKYQDKDNLLLNNEISDEKGNQITDMIKETYPHIVVKLDGGTWINYKPIFLLEVNNITVPLQKGGK